MAGAGARAIGREGLRGPQIVVHTCVHTVPSAELATFGLHAAAATLEHRGSAPRPRPKPSEKGGVSLSFCRFSNTQSCAMASFGSKRKELLGSQGTAKKQTGTGSKPGQRLAPLFSSGESRLAACPLCSRHVHKLLLTAHVEAHFSGTEAGEPREPLLALMDRPHQEECQPDAAGAAGAAGEAVEENLRAEGGAAGASPEDVPRGPLAERSPPGASAENTPPTGELWRVMSGDATCCGLCLEPFDAERLRFLFWPCQHLRQCGDCAIRVWSQPKGRRRCPWCSGKLEVRPKAFRPWL